MQKKEEKRIRLKQKIRSKISGSDVRPRLSVFRSNKFVYAQLIDDTKGKTLASASDIKSAKDNKVNRAKAVGQSIAKAAKSAGITKVVFDRNGFKYTGRIKSVADAAREGGLIF